MGGVVSAGTNNSELVDNLVYADILKTPEIEKVFRAVDRGVYYLPEHREGAYKDRAWKHKNLHLSAPCIYGEVMEALELKRGMSFLNLGSGTGYLSTMAGLILGPYGTNHGIEIHQDVVEYSEKQLKDFISSNEYFDAFEFCLPVFHCGNCLNLSPTTMNYDRVYCGAACLPKNEEYIKSFVKVGGLLVMPLGDELIKAKRVSETEWENNGIMAVSFADLIPSADDGKHSIELSEPTVVSLQEVCRIAIRRVMKKNIDNENPDTTLFVLHCNQKKNKRKQKRIPNSQDGCNVPPPELNRHPFIRVSFLPSGGRFMFVRSFSDNEEDDNESMYDVDGDHFLNDTLDAAEVHIENDGNENLNATGHDHADSYTNNDDDMTVDSTFKSDSNLTDEKSGNDNNTKVSSNSKGEDLSGMSNELQNPDNLQVTAKATIEKTLNGRNPAQSQKVGATSSSSLTFNDDISNDYECKPQSCKKQRTHSLQEGSKSTRMDTMSSSEQSNTSRGVWSNFLEKLDRDLKSVDGNTTIENDNSFEKSKLPFGQQTSTEARSQLMSVSSGIGTHESMELDDETGFDSSSCDHQEIRMNSSSSSSPSSTSLSSPPRSTNDQPVDPIDLLRSSLTAPQSAPRSNRESGGKGSAPGKDEEDSDSNDAVEPEVELLNYKIHMEEKINSLPIPLMLKNFLMYDRLCIHHDHAFQ